MIPISSEKNEDYSICEDEFERCLLERQRHHHKRHSNTHLILALSGVILVIVVAVLYAIYMIVHYSGLSDAANVHVGSGIKQEIRTLIEGKEVYEGNFLPGTENWSAYVNRDLGFEFRYPQKWKLKVEDQKVTLQKYNKENNGFESLSHSIHIGYLKNPKQKELEDFLDENDRMLGKKYKKIVSGGEKAILTETFLTKSKLRIYSVYWEMDEAVYYFDVVDYNKEKDSSDTDPEIILKTFKFL